MLKAASLLSTVAKNRPTMLDLFSIGLIVIIIGLWIRWRMKKFTVFKELGIPGPPPSILFGNVIEMIRKDPMACQDEWIKKYGDVLGYYYGSWPVLLISNPDHMRQVLIKDFTSFADRPSNFLAFEGDSPDQEENRHMINLKGKRWKEVRNMLTPVFTSGKLKQMMPLLDDASSLMIRKLDALSGNGSKDVEMYSLFQGLTMDAIGRSAFGIEAPVQNNPKHPLLRLSKLFLDVQFQTLLTILVVSFREFHFLINGVRKLLYSFYAGGKHPLRALFQLSSEVVQIRKSNPSARRVDLLQTIIDARSTDEDISESSLTASTESHQNERENNEQINRPSLNDKSLRKLNDIEVTANAFLFFLAGYETTSASLGFLMHHLVNNPDVQEKVRQEVFEVSGREGPVTYDHLSGFNYMDRVIMESLRMHPVVYNFENRLASKEFQLGKWKIPAGMTVQIPVWNLHYDPIHFEDPHTFNPDRFLPENRSKNHSVTWQPFGSGPRNCIGMRFALTEIKLTMAKLLTKYRFEPTKKTERENPKLRVNLVIFHLENGIHVRAVPI